MSWPFSESNLNWNKSEFSVSLSKPRIWKNSAVGNWSTQQKSRFRLQGKCIYSFLNEQVDTVTYVHTLHLNTLQISCLNKLSNPLTHYILTKKRKIKDCSSQWYAYNAKFKYAWSCNYSCRIHSRMYQFPSLPSYLIQIVTNIYSDCGICDSVPAYLQCVIY